MRKLFRRAAAALCGAVLAAVSMGFPGIAPAQLHADAAAEVQIPGIDVSKYQDEIDWETVAAAGEKFAIIRVAMIVHARGVEEFDIRFEENYERARNAGLAVGCYMYTDAATEAEFSQDVAFMLRHLENKSFDFPVFLDLESRDRQEHLSPEVFMPGLLSGLSQIEKAGFTAGIYANTAFFSECLSREMLARHNYHVWEANYYNTVNGLYSPAGHDLSDTAGLWQYSGCGRVSGIRTIVDRNICYRESYFQHSVTLEDARLPMGILEQGAQFSTAGTVTGEAVIRSVTGTVFQKKTQQPAGMSVTVTPNARRAELSGEFSRGLVFSALPEGEYTLKITAIDSSGKTLPVAESDFRVFKSATYEPGKRAGQVAIDHAISQAGSTGTTTTTTTTTTTVTTTTTTETETTADPFDTEFVFADETGWDSTVTTEADEPVSTKPRKDPKVSNLQSSGRLRLALLIDLFTAVNYGKVLQKGAEIAEVFSEKKAGEIRQAKRDADACLYTAKLILDAKQ